MSYGDEQERERERDWERKRKLLEKNRRGILFIQLLRFYNLDLAVFRTQFSNKTKKLKNIPFVFLVSLLSRYIILPFSNSMCYLMILLHVPYQIYPCCYQRIWYATDNKYYIRFTWVLSLGSSKELQVLQMFLSLLNKKYVTLTKDKKH